MTSLTDTHCHLYLPHFDKDRDSVIKHAIDAGITRILVPGIDIKTSEQALNLCAMYPKVIFAAIGIHPNSKKDFVDKTIEMLRPLAKSANVVAIGEIGLDYYRLGNSADQQKMMFLAQLELAKELDLPVCIHNRDADDDALEIVEKWRHSIQNTKKRIRSLPGVFHSFSGSSEMAARILSNNFYIGISGIVTYKKNQELQDVLRISTLEKIIIETDSPYLPPHPFRGQRNLPAYVKYVAQELSNIFKQENNVIANITSENANALFHWQ